jgi:hypothetical protein
VGIAVTLVFFHSTAKKWLDEKLAKRVRRRESVSKYEDSVSREMRGSTAPGVYAAPPLDEEASKAKAL